jgi:hypothetical protein
MSLMTLSETAVRTHRAPRWSELKVVFTEWCQRTRYACIK